MADSLRRDSFILKKIHRENPHRVDRILTFTGGLILLIVGIWGELPNIW
ncbi:MAG: hypothetical protein JSV52_11540 [Candidatus Zixiibacteriota bacterium]|nr:MAG: hypothetical protein JSV52_11540 [candidate division Zixibacteria bacterium]